LEKDEGHSGHPIKPCLNCICQLMKKKFTASTILVIAVIVLALLCLFLLFLAPEFVRSRLQNWHIKEPGQIGDVFGGTLGPFIAFLAAILTFAAFWAQYQANLQQKEQFTIQALNSGIERFESRFFDLLKLHRDNVNEMEFVENKVVRNPTYLKEESRARGREVIKKICFQIFNCRDEISPFFSKKLPKHIYNEEYMQKVQNEPTIIERSINLRDMAKNDIAYCIVFFGLDHNGLYVAKKNLHDKYHPTFIDPILNFLSLKPINGSEYWPRWRKLNRSSSPFKKLLVAEMITKKRKDKEYQSETKNVNLDSYFFPEDNEKYYCGFQLQLGHYFRHLYQSVNFLNDQTIFDYQRKYNYAKILRAQLSTYEQVIFYYNSVSSLGNIWELIVSKRFNLSIEQVKKQEIYNKQLITKYNLIKNLPGGQLYRQDFQKFYPHVEFEYENKKKNLQNVRLYT
jgi:hypothetical protein